MIRSLTLLVALGLAAPARADDSGPTEAPGEGDPADDLRPYREPFEVLADRTIGSTSTPVEFNWRRTKVQVAATGTFLAELNNFNTLRGGAAVRLPTNGAVVELGLAYAKVWDTPSSELLAYTPYRQPGRPTRGELDVLVGLPLAEGVVTVRPRWFPAVQMVLQSWVGLRYNLTPRAFQGMRVGQVATALLNPAYTETELENLDRTRLDAMQLDPGRYGFVAGFGNDFYFKQGLFVAPRLLFSVPLLAGASGSELRWWADVSLALGVAF